MKSIVNLLVMSFFITFTGLTQNDSIINQSCIDKIDSTYKALLEKNKVVGTSIALVKDGKVIYTTGYGFQDKEKEIKATKNTVYRIGSCSKSFTAISLLQLQEKNKVNLSSPIQDYLPQITIKSRFDQENPIYINSILTHTSGLPSDLLNGFFCDTPPSIDWLIEQLNNCTMAAPANYQQSYSNTGYGILGKLISSTSGKEYGQYVKDNVFTPLGMNSSFIDDLDNTSPNMSVGYINGDAVQEVQIRDQAAGLIASSASDMAIYLNMFLANGKGTSGQIISESSLKEMQKNGTSDITLPTSSEWGYGLYSEYLNFATENDSSRVKMIGHGGDTWAFHADFKFIPELGIGAVVLTNTDKGVRMSSAKRLLGIYLREMEGKKQYYPKKEVVNSRDQECSSNDIIGDYYFSGIHMDVQNPSKIKMNQGAHKIIMKAVNDSLYYNGKIRLFGVVPMKIKHQEFKFVKYDDQVYFKVVMTKTGNEDYVSRKSTSVPISEAWKNSLGKYVPSGEVYSCKDCSELNFEGLKMELFEKKGKLKMKIKTKDKSVDEELILEIHSDQLSVTPGIGRNTGETVRILENGNVFYSGFEFKLQ